MKKQSAHGRSDIQPVATLDTMLNTLMMDKRKAAFDRDTPLSMAKAGR